MRPRRFSPRQTFIPALLFAIAWRPCTPEVNNSGIPHLSAREARESVLAAVRTFNSIRSRDGKISLVNLDLQTNTIAGILHNLIGKKISARNDYWRFIHSGAAGGDLVGKNNEPLELKTSSSLEVKGNQVSHNQRYYLVTHFVVYPALDRLVVVWIRGGLLEPDDWRRPKGTQWAFLNKKGNAKLKTIWKDFGALPTSYLPGIGKKREALLAKAGIYTVKQLALAPTVKLQAALLFSTQQVERLVRAARSVQAGTIPRALRR